MDCPSCMKELKLDGEFFHSDIELDGTAGVEGSITITFSCAECGDEFGEYDFELEQNIENWSVNHDEDDGHELSVELGDESFDEYTDKYDGKVYPGASATIKISCSCGSEIQYLWKNYDDPDVIIGDLDIQ